MAEYAKTFFSDFLSVKSIITVFHTDLKGTKSLGESHNFWEFLYVDKGNHKVSVDNTIYSLEEGQMIVYAPLSFHIAPEHSEAKVNIVSFESTSDSMSYFSNRIITLSGKQRQILSRIMSIGEKCFEKISPDSGLKGMVPRKEAEASELQNLKNNLELLLIDMYEKNESTSSKVRNSNYENQCTMIFETITKYFKNNVTNTLTLDEICRDCTISLSQLKRVCQTQCGMSPMSYFISLKLDEAKKMINESNMNFTQISEALGFTTLHYFSKLFKNKVGVSPSEYAKSVYKK